MKVALSKVRLDEDECIVEGFPAELEGIRVWVTAVLERTCVYETPERERKLVSKEKLLVERDGPDPAPACRWTSRSGVEVQAGGGREGEGRGSRRGREV